MNNYVLARNALIASMFIMLFMISLQPDRISTALMGISDTISSTFIEKREIDAAEKKAQKEQLSVNFDSVEIVLPTMEGFTLDKNGRVVLVKDNDETRYVITLEEYQGDLQQKALTFAKELKADPSNENISVQPVMRGSNMYVEVSSLSASDERKVNYALKRVNDSEIVVIVPSSEASNETTSKLLSEMSFN